MSSLVYRQQIPRRLTRRAALGRLSGIGLAIGATALAACTTRAAPASPTASTPSKPADTGTAAQAAPPQKKTVPMRVSLIQGSQTPPTLMMQKLKIFEKYGIDAEILPQAGPDAAHTAIRTGGVDIGGMGMHTIAAQFLQGAPVLNVYSMIDFSNDWLVPVDSPFQSLADLNGKTIGYYAGPGTPAPPFAYYIMKRWYGIDAEKNTRSNFGAPPVIAAMLQNKEIDAAFMLDPITSSLIETGNVRLLANTNEEYRKRLGKVPLLVSVGINREYGEKYPEAVTNYIRGFQEAVQALRGNTELWQEVGKQVGLKTEAGIKAFQGRSESIYNARWDEQVIADQKQMWMDVVNEVGETFLPKWPDEAFTTRFNPT